jgi:hypothetical protein
LANVTTVVGIGGSVLCLTSFYFENSILKQKLKRVRYGEKGFTFHSDFSKASSLGSRWFAMVWILSVIFLSTGIIKRKKAESKQ